MTSLQQLNIESFKEGNRLEAKLAKGGVPASLWETYASFANTDGGLILLGVKENKNHTFAIEGIDNPEQMEKFTSSYRRNGEGDYLCSREEVVAIFRDAGQVTQDNKLIVEVNLDALCKETITHYRRRFMLVHQGHVWNNLSEVFSKCFR